MKVNIETIGVYSEQTILHPNRFWCNVLQDYIDITEDKNIEDVIEMIYEEGIKRGIDEGKEIRSKEIGEMFNTLIRLE